MEQLKNIYNKGFSSGFFLGLPTSDDFSKTEHSSALEKKHFIGKITHYFPKVKVAAVKLVSELKIGDEIVVIGKTTGVINSKIERIEFNNKQIKKAIKGQEAGIKLPSLARRNDEVYVIIKNKFK